MAKPIPYGKSKGADWRISIPKHHLSNCRFQNAVTLNLFVMVIKEAMEISKEFIFDESEIADSIMRTPVDRSMPPIISAGKCRRYSRRI